jgi:multiple sugar transport system substrate-binding protein
VLNRTAKLVAATIVAATLPFTLAACSKGGTSTNAATPGGTQTLSLWTHSAGNKAELAAVQQIITDYNGSQTKFKVDLQAFPQESYNQSVVAAAAAKKLPCILDTDGPNVPNWAWAGYLEPLVGMDDTLSKFLPSAVGKWNGRAYSFGYGDVALNFTTRKSTLQKYGIRVSSIDKPWTSDELTAALTKIRDSGDFKYAFDLQTGNTGEWLPYAYSPLLQSFGGDLINRSDFKSAQGALNGPEALAWAKWFRSLVTDKFMALKAGADPGKDFLNGKTAIIYNGSWGAADARKQFGDDILFLPPVDLGKGPKIGGGSWQWAISTGCASNEGALDYMKFAAQDKYVASVSTATSGIPATDAAAELVPGFQKGGENDIFRQFAKKYAVLRPPTPGYTFIATEFAKTAQEILNGADPQQALDTAVKNIDANQESNNYFQ